MTTKYADLLGSVQEKLDSDVDFQNSLVDLSDDDKNQAIAAKQEELLDLELGALNEKATKAEANYNSQKIRAEKAEAEAKKPKTEKETPKNEDKDLSGDDLFALMDAKVQKVDLPLVKTTAKALGLSITESLSHPVLKTILKNAEEERQTAQATSTGSTRKSSISSKDVLQRAFKNELKDDEMKEGAKAIMSDIFKK